jgi:ADP-ribose pyrophosphatase YjhB (NUDIX family)
MKRDSYCSFCGTAYPDTSRYPRTCPGCGVQVWANPIPVSIVLVPVQGVDGRVGLLVVRRAIEPRRGLLGLVGGFLEEHETWQEGGAREVMEEADVRLDPGTLAPFWFVSTEPRPHRVLLFSLAPTVPATALTAFSPTSETSERGIVRGPQGLDDIFAFPLHARAVQRFFEARGLDGPHDYLQI